MLDAHLDRVRAPVSMVTGWHDIFLPAQLAAQTADRAPLRALQAWIPDHLDEDLTVPALARRACMSERNFARAFRRETGLNVVMGTGWLSESYYPPEARIDRRSVDDLAAGMGTIGYEVLTHLGRRYHRVYKGG